MKILGDRVLLEQLPPERQTAGGLMIPPQYFAEQQVHRVLELGTKVTEPLSIGDLVLLDQYTINNRTAAGENRWIIATRDISLAVGR